MLRTEKVARSAHKMPFGAEVRDNATHFRLWAPAESRVIVEVQGLDALAMNALAEGWHELTIPNVSAGNLYSFRLSDGLTVPDPASRFLPSDVHGPSQVI